MVTGICTKLAVLIRFLYVIEHDFASDYHLYELTVSALDVQNCGLTEKSTAVILQMLASNKTLVVIDLRINDVCLDSLSKVRNLLRENDRAPEGKVSTCHFLWLQAQTLSVYVTENITMQTTCKK